MKKAVTFGCLFLLLFEIAGFSQSYVFEVRVKGSREWGYANLDGEVIIEPQFNVSNQFSENGRAVVAPLKQYVIIDLEGNIIEVEVEIVEFHRDPWRGAPIYNDGLLRFSRIDKWGALNTSGKLQIPFKYDYLTDFNGGFAIAEIANDFFVIDTAGNETPVSDPTIKAVKHFTEGLAPCKGKRNKWGYINSSGKVAITPQFSSVGYFSGGLAWVKGKSEKIGYIDKEGNWAINPRFIGAKNFDAESGMALVMLDDKNYYVGRNGKLSSFEQTSKLYPFSDGLAIARWNEKIGFINNNMEWEIPPKYVAARPFHNGYAAVKYDSRWGIIDKEGNVILEPKFMDIRDVEIVDPE